MVWARSYDPDCACYKSKKEMLRETQEEADRDGTFTLESVLTRDH